MQIPGGVWGGMAMDEIDTSINGFIFLELMVFFIFPPAMLVIVPGRYKLLFEVLVVHSQ